MSRDPVASRHRARSLPRSERRSQLLECAMRVFARRGIGAARHAEIAAEAGVAVPTVFSYFPSRPALVESVLREVDRFLIEMIESVAAEGASASETLLGIVRAFADRGESHPDHVTVWLDWSTSIRGDVWPLYQDFQARVIEAFMAIVRRGQDSGELPATLDAEAAAYLVVGSGNMIAQMKLTRRDPERIQRFLETVVNGALRPS